MVDKKLPIEELVDTFMKQHPNYLNNKVTMEEVDKEFQKIVIDTAINYLEGIPLELKTLNKNAKSYMAHFQCWHTIKPYFDFQKPIKEAYFDVVTVVPDSLVESLKEGEYYLLSGAIIEQVNYDTFNFLLGKNTRVMTPLFGIRKNDIYEDEYDVNLGMLYYHLDSIKPYTQREQIEEKY